MIESRCGTLCNACTYKETVGCKGCVAMDKPFWGDTCAVKSCCESKQQSHCGECHDFPCALLHEFSYDKEQGDNGKRIEQCKLWRI